MKRIESKANRGFTLVELLIVVAIIGVLSTIGVPTFKKMVQKAKKSEAKTSLGALYTAETAFFSEYGFYGNNLPGIAYELDGSSANRLYVTGFPSATCSAAAAIAPSATTAATFSLAVPTYYTNPVYFYGASATLATCAPGTVPADGSSYSGTASGMISSVAGAAVDEWNMDNLRNLSNLQDGIY